MGFFHRPVTLNLRYHMLIKMIPRSIAKQNNHSVQFSGSSNSSVLLYTLFMDYFNTLGYKLGSTDDTGIPDYYASQAGDFICDASFSHQFAQFFLWHFFCGFMRMGTSTSDFCVYM